MSTLTIRNVPEEVTESLKQRAKRRGHSMEQEVREILGRQLAARDDVLDQVAARWEKLPARPSAKSIQDWIKTARQGGRP